MNKINSAEKKTEIDKKVVIEFIIDGAQREKYFAKFTQKENIAFIESMIIKILECSGVYKILTPMDVTRVAYIAKQLFKIQGRMIEIDGPVRVCGDIHGQFPDLVRIFQAAGFPPSSNYLFLGDYVDRGKYGLEVLLLCLCYKVRYPHNFFMLRGNHECESVNRSFGFKEEVISRIEESAEHVYADIIDMMDWMPLTGLIGGLILCMHGGISPKLESLDDLRNVQAPTKVEVKTLEEDVLWSDPAMGELDFAPSARDAGVNFGEVAVRRMCAKLGIDLIIRGHQVVENGFCFFAGSKLLTIFSAPCYMGYFNNDAAICNVSANLEIFIERLRPKTTDLAETSLFQPSAATTEESTGN